MPDDLLLARQLGLVLLRDACVDGADVRGPFLRYDPTLSPSERTPRVLAALSQWQGRAVGVDELRAALPSK